MPFFKSDDLLGRTFITNPDSDHEQHRARIDGIELLQQSTADGAQPLFKFKCSSKGRTFEEVITYNKMLDWVKRDQHKPHYHRLEAILNHRKNRKAWGGYELRIQWANGEKTWEPINLIFEDDPITMAWYAKKNSLLDTPGWKRCKRFICNDKTIARMIKQVQLRNHRN